MYLAKEGELNFTNTRLIQEKFFLRYLTNLMARVCKKIVIWYLYDICIG